MDAPCHEIWMTTVHPQLDFFVIGMRGGGGGVVMVVEVVCVWGGGDVRQLHTLQGNYNENDAIKDWQRYTLQGMG